MVIEEMVNNKQSFVCKERKNTPVDQIVKQFKIIM